MRAPAYRLAMRLLPVWWFVRRPRTRGVRCALWRDGAVVLVRHTYGDRRWMLPGGRVRRGEDVLAAARREMSQELGVSGEGWEVAGSLAGRREWRRRSREDGARRHSTFYVHALVVSPGDLNPRSGELDDARWFPVAELPADRSENVDVALRGGWLPNSRR